MKKYRLLLLVTVFFLAAAETTAGAQLPENPRAYVETSFPLVRGATHMVRQGDDLQAVLDRAEPGDEIVLEAGATFPGPLTLRKKSGEAWILVRGSRLSELPSGTRVSPAAGGLLPKITSPGRNANALRTEEGAHHYWIAGIEFAKRDPSAIETNLINLGSDAATALDQVPHHIVLDRVYAHGDPTSNLRRCVTLNSAHTAIIHSHLSDCHEVGVDAQAIGGWNGPGPFRIFDNYIEGSGENILFGGADPKIPGLIPSDIEIRNNLLTKPLSWKIGSPGYAGKPWTVKNLFELKNAQRVLVDNNIFENSWTHGQTGVGILLKSANQDGRCPWCQTRDVSFTNNTVRGVEEGFTINASEGKPLPPPVARVLVRNSIIHASRRPFSIYNGVEEVTLERVTALGGHSTLYADGGGDKNGALTIRNSILERGTYGIGAGSIEGSAYLERWFAPAVFEHNLIVSTKDALSESLRRKYPGAIFREGLAGVLRDPGAGDYVVIDPSVHVGARPSAPPLPTPPLPSAPTPPAAPSPAAPSSGEEAVRVALQNQIRALLAQVAALQAQLTPPNSLFLKDLAYGMRGHNEVVRLQSVLKNRGFYSGPVTGNFFELTRAAVRRLQATEGIPATGYVGPLTRARLNGAK